MSEMDEFRFSKIKTTSQIFYQKYGNFVKFYNTHFIFSAIPYSINYGGTYWIHSCLKDDNSFLIYKTLKQNELSENPDIWIVQISKTNGKITLYNELNEGIILKR